MENDYTSAPIEKEKPKPIVSEEPSE